MVPLSVRHTELQVASLLRKLAWLTLFIVAKKSLVVWIDELK